MSSLVLVVVIFLVITTVGKLGRFPIAMGKVCVFGWVGVYLLGGLG